MEVPYHRPPWLSGSYHPRFGARFGTIEFAAAPMANTEFGQDGTDGKLEVADGRGARLGGCTARPH